MHDNFTQDENGNGRLLLPLLLHTPIPHTCARCVFVEILLYSCHLAYKTQRAPYRSLLIGINLNKHLHQSAPSLSSRFACTIFIFTCVRRRQRHAPMPAVAVPHRKRFFSCCCCCRCRFVRLLRCCDAFVWMWLRRRPHYSKQQTKICITPQPSQQSSCSFYLPKNTLGTPSSGGPYSSFIDFVFELSGSTHVCAHGASVPCIARHHHSSSLFYSSFCI